MIKAAHIGFVAWIMYGEKAIENLENGFGALPFFLEFTAQAHSGIIPPVL